MPLQPLARGNQDCVEDKQCGESLSSSDRHTVIDSICTTFLVCCFVWCFVGLIDWLIVSKFDNAVSHYLRQIVRQINRLTDSLHCVAVLAGLHSHPFLSFHCLYFPLSTHPLSSSLIHHHCHHHHHHHHHHYRAFRSRYMSTTQMQMSQWFCGPYLSSCRGIWSSYMGTRGRSQVAV